jgi:hypothetical protein
MLWPLPSISMQPAMQHSLPVLAVCLCVCAVCWLCAVCGPETAGRTAAGAAHGAVRGVAVMALTPRTALVALVLLSWLGATVLVARLACNSSSPPSASSSRPWVLPSHGADDRGTNILEWARSHGAVVNGELGMFPKGGVQVLGVKATRDIAAGEVLMSLPRQLILTADTIRSSPIGAVFGSGVLSSLNPPTIWNDEDVMALFICWIMARPADAGMWGVYGRTLANTDVRALPPMLSRAQQARAIRQHRLSKASMAPFFTTLEQQVGRLHRMAKAVLASPANRELRAPFTATMLRKKTVARALALVRSREQQAPD